MNEPAPPSGRSSANHSSLWLVAALAAVILAIPNLSYPIGRDQATYAVIGRGLLHAQALYQRLWDNKPPGIFFIFALIVEVFGRVMWSVGVVDVLWLAAISLLIFRFTEPTMGRGAAAIAVLVNAVWHLRAGYWDAAQPETFLMLCVFGSYLLMSGDRPRASLRRLGSGMLFAAAFWIKYNAAAFLPFVLFVPFLDWAGLDGPPWRARLSLTWRRWVACLGWFAAGVAMVSTVVLSYFVFSHSWSAFWQENVQVLPRYARAALTATPGSRPWAFDSIRRWLGLWSITAAAVAPLLAWKRKRLGELAPGWLGAASGFLALAIQIRYQPYYFETCYPFFAMLWGYLAVEMYAGFGELARACRRRGWMVASSLVWLAFADLVALAMPGPVVRAIVNYKALGEWLHGPEQFYASYAWPGAAEDFRDVLRVVKFLRQHPAPPGGVYVWGNEPLIYFLSGHSPPTRFVWNLALIAPWRLPGWRGELLHDLRRAQPLYLIVARHDAVPTLSGTLEDSEQALRAFPALAAFVSSGYRLQQADGDFLIYGRKGSARSVTAGSQP